MTVFVRLQSREGRFIYSQLQQSQIGVTVVTPIFTLCSNVFLEDVGGLWVVSIETVQDRIDVFRPVGRIIEGNTHFVLLVLVFVLVVDEVGIGMGEERENFPSRLLSGVGLKASN